MNELCIACLCSDRNLFYLKDSEIYQLYIQILNEISVSTNMILQVCWECHALLHKFHKFKRQAQESYSELLGIGHQSATCKLPKSQLQMKQLYKCSYPVDVPMEMHLGLKVEKVDDEDTHCEPDTFVHNLLVEQDKVLLDNGETTSNKKQTLKVKSKKKKEVKSKMLSEEENDFDCLEGMESEREFPCTQCALSFVDEIELDKHTVTEHTVKRVKKKSKQKVKLKKKNVQSKKLTDVESSFACQEGMESEKEFPCQQCALSFVDELQRDKHTDTAHVVKKTSKVIETGARPERDVLPDKPQCVECGKMFSSRKTYRYHLNVLHRGQNRYPCPRCGKVYQWKSNLGRHMRSHKARDNGELHCDTCDKRFASVATYRQHLRVSRQHVSENDFTFMCNECGKKFVNKTRLRDHIDWEHLKKIKFRCQLCDKPFKCHTSLYVHVQNVHNNKEKKENLCHVCGKSYPNAAKLKYHIVAMHTSETPYRCAQCGAAFGWYSSLYRHVREVHYKVKLQPNRIKKKTKKSELVPLLQQAGPS